MTHILVIQAYSHSATACQGKITPYFWLALDRRVTKWNNFEEVEDNDYVTPSSGNYRNRHTWAFMQVYVEEKKVCGELDVIYI